MPQAGGLPHLGPQLQAGAGVLRGGEGGGRGVLLLLEAGPSLRLLAVYELDPDVGEQILRAFVLGHRARAAAKKVNS